MIYLWSVVSFLWLMISFGTGFILCIFKWGDLRINRFTARLFGRPLLWLLGIKLEVENFENIEKHQPCIYVANHQGALDIVTFGAIYPNNTVVIGKKEISYIPVLNVYFVAAGNILVDRKKRSSAVASLGKAINAIRKRDASVWIFPEGTRNRTENVMLPLKKGAFYMAVEAQIPVVPVVSGSLKSVFNRAERRLMRGTLKMKVLPPIPTTGLTSSDVEALSQRVHSIMVEAVRGLSS
jgi:lysophosphatidate acyltransferase